MEEREGTARVEGATEGSGMTQADVFVARAKPATHAARDWRSAKRIPTSYREGLVVAVLLAVLMLVYLACLASALTGSPQDGASLEERRQRDLVCHGKGAKGGEGHVHAAVLDHAEVLGVQPRSFRRRLLGQFTLFSKLAETKPKTALRAFDRLHQRRAKLHL